MDYPVDYFTGDGTSTTFQLSRIPASATSILVHIGGVKQVASTTDPAYYLDGSKLVFVSPPGAYSPIEVNYLGIAGQVNIPGVQSVTQDMLSLQLANTFVYQTTANGATASFTLNAPPVSANSLVVSANGVVQYDYSVNGNNLTFGFTPPVGTFIRVTSLALAQAGVPADGSVTSVKLGANLTITGNTTFDGFAGNPARIRGDFSNGTIASRAAFQSSTTNGNTVVGALPNGTGSVTSFQTFNNSDPTNAAAIGIVATSTDMRLSSFITGTGTYLPMTFLTGGSERMRIDTSGDMQIGGTTALGRLAVYHTSTAPSLSSNSGVGLSVRGSSTLRLNMGSDPSSPFGGWIQSSDGAGNSFPLNLNPLGGNVGIGTNNPSSRLDVSGVISLQGTTLPSAGTARIYSRSSDSSTYIQTATSGSIYLLDGAQNTMAAFGSSTLQFLTNNSERMRIASTGEVGIGTSSPSTRLHVEVSGASSIITNKGTSANYYGYAGSTLVTQLLSSSTQTFLNSVANVPVIFGTNDTERMRIDSSGNVGIGTTTPDSFSRGYTRILGLSSTGSTALEINSATGSNAVIDMGVNGTRSFSITTDGTTPYISSIGVLPIGFAINGVERMRIASNGNVGIGTSSPGAPLTIRTPSSIGDGGVLVSNGSSTELLQIFQNGYFRTGQAVASPFNNTTGSSANVVVASDGALLRSTSSIKYKKEVKDATHGLSEVLQLRPVTYKGNSKADENSDKVFGGLIAEEVDAIGLTEFVVYRDDDGTPDAIAYGNMVSLLAKAIQELNAKVEAQAAEIALLKSK